MGTSYVDGTGMTEENQNSDGESQVNDDAVETTDETTDESTETETAAEAASDSEAAAEDAPASQPAKSSPAETDVAALWPVEKDHGSVTRMLTRETDHVDLESDEVAKGGMFNAILVLLIIAAAAGGIFQLRIVSSAEALEAKRLERQAKEEAFLKEQLAKQKKYGVLRIESNPSQATVVKDGEAIQVAVTPTAAAAVPAGAPGAEPGKAAADSKAPAAKAAPAAPAPAAPAPGAATAAAGGKGGVKAGMTPMNIMNLDIAQVYKFRVEKVGYEPFEFSLAEHLWTKDPTTNEYKFFKSIEPTPINCEYWFLYDAKQRREVRFQGKCTEAREELLD